MPGICSHLTSLDVLSRSHRPPLALASCFAALRTTLEQTPDTPPWTHRALARTPKGLLRCRRGGLPGMFFEEVKRTEGSHDEKNRPRSPPSAEQEQIPGINARATQL